MTNHDTRYYKDEARYKRDVERYGQELADRLDQLYSSTPGHRPEGFSVRELHKDIQLGNAAADFRLSVEGSRGTLTVGMLRDWLDACTTDDDLVELSHEDGIIVVAAVPGLNGGPERTTNIYLEPGYSGSLVETHCTIPGIRHPFYELQATGRDVQPPTTDESETDTHG